MPWLHGLPVDPLSTADTELPQEEVDDVRPPYCPCCRTPAVRYEGARRKVVLQSNGRRTRPVVVPPRPGSSAPRTVRVWVRRFECQACGAAPSVLPAGVVPGHLYSLMAMLEAWLLAAPRPVGEARREGEVARRARSTEAHGRRWRSPSRWARHIAGWFPMLELPSSDLGWRSRVGRLLLALAPRAGSLDLEALAPVAIACHSQMAAVR
ncbi:MAG: hypothetical protein ACI9K2_005339 [Myxococcota bacterium]|jgi:hypothetical protein